MSATSAFGSYTIPTSDDGKRSNAPPNILQSHSSSKRRWMNGPSAPSSWPLLQRIDLLRSCISEQHRYVVGI